MSMEISMTCQHLQQSVSHFIIFSKGQLFHHETCHGGDQLEWLTIIASLMQRKTEQAITNMVNAKNGFMLTR